MISLHPALPDVTFDCPHCSQVMQADGWTMPGSWMLGTYTCSHCGRRYYGTLPSGHGINLPSLLDAQTGLKCDDDPSNYFAVELQRAFASRGSAPLDVKIERLRSMTKAVLINCLDNVYGNGLMKLLNAQHYLDRGMDVWVIVPRYLRWLVPDGVAEIWSVNLPLSNGKAWNDPLAEQIKERVSSLDECHLAMLFILTNENDYDIQRFTRVKPFPLDDWQTHVDAPVITFIWREDRPWVSGPHIHVKRPLRRLIQATGVGVAIQTRHINALAARLWKYYPSADFAVAGIGRRGHLASKILDLRKLPSEMDEQVERQWCERYARSHIVIGVEGSNMLLPSAHAASVIQLIPPDRYGHTGVIPSARKSFRDTIFRYRMLPVESSPKLVAKVAMALLNRIPQSLLLYDRPWNDHDYVETRYQELWQRMTKATKGTRRNLK